MSRKQSIFLVGPSGAGKSTIGYELARLLKFDFVDSDAVIEARTGVSISWIYDVEGEAGFQKRQAAVIQALVETPGIVLATGGDVVMLPENCHLLAARGYVVYLKASIDQQLARTTRKDHRPLLQVDDVAQRILELFAEREHLYESIADASFDTEGHSIRHVAKQIYQHLTHAKIFGA